MSAGALEEQLSALGAAAPPATHLCPTRAPRRHRARLPAAGGPRRRRCGSGQLQASGRGTHCHHPHGTSWVQLTNNQGGGGRPGRAGRAGWRREGPGALRASHPRSPRPRGLHSCPVCNCKAQKAKPPAALSRLACSYLLCQAWLLLPRLLPHPDPHLPPQKPQPSHRQQARQAGGYEQTRLRSLHRHQV